MKENFFYELLKTGQLRVTKEGLVILMGEYNLMFPTRVFLYLQEMLVKSFGVKGEKLLYDMGKYQTTEAIKRYLKIYNIQKLQKSKIIEFGLKVCTAIGLGSFEIVKYNPDNLNLILINKKLPTAELYKLTRGRSEKPIDFHISGLFSGAFSAMFGKNVECIETKCLACGDPYCQFEVSPKIKPFK